MASPSYRQKNAEALSPDVIARVLRGGSVHPAEKPDAARAAQHLASLRLIETRMSEYVQCASHRDRDYRYVRNRSCRGRIRIGDELDSGDSLECPECGRTVYPRGKARHRVMQVRVKPKGVAAFLEGLLQKRHLQCKQLQPWVWRVDAPDGEVKLVVVDYCTPECVAREWAASNRACYVVVDAARCRQRFLPDEWLTWTRLADIVCRPDALTDLLSSAATMDLSSQVRASVPVYSAAIRPVVLGAPPAKGRSRVRKKPNKRASRAAAIDAIKQALREHLRAARDHAYTLREHDKPAELLPRPTQEQLAQQLHISTSSVSRAINDPSDKEITILWEAANDLEQVLRFKG